MKKQDTLWKSFNDFLISIFLIRNSIFSKQVLQYKGLVGRIKKREKEDLYIKQKDKNKSLINIYKDKNTLYLHKIS